MNEGKIQKKKKLTHEKERNIFKGVKKKQSILKKGFNEDYFDNQKSVE